MDLNKIAQATAGCVGADLANLVNEAALRAVRKGRKAVNQNDLLVSFELVIAGSEKKGTVITEEEKRIIAYHEVGHALVAAKQKHAQPVSKITIVPHTQGALGYTLHLPEEEKFLMSREDILAEIRTLLAGRSSEEIVCNTMTSGAANDIERATELARNLVARFGMCDEFDMMALGTVQSQYLDGGYSMTCAQETYAAADRETIKIIRQCHQEAKEILTENREMLDKIAAYLLKKETITGQEMMAIIEGRDPETVDNYGATREDDQKLFRPSVPNTIDVCTAEIIGRKNFHKIGAAKVCLAYFAGCERPRKRHKTAFYRFFNHFPVRVRRNYKKSADILCMTHLLFCKHRSRTDIHFSVKFVAQHFYVFGGFFVAHRLVRTVRYFDKSYAAVVQRPCKRDKLIFFNTPYYRDYFFFFYCFYHFFSHKFHPFQNP